MKIAHQVMFSASKPKTRDAMCPIFCLTDMLINIHRTSEFHTRICFPGELRQTGDIENV